MNSTLLPAALLVVLAAPAVAEVPLVRWGSAVSASLSQAPLPMLELDTDLQERHGVRVETVDFRGNTTNCMAAIIAGEVDICQNGITIGQNAIAQGADLVGFMQLIGQITEITLSSAVVERTGVGPDAPLADRVAAMRGLRLAGPGAGSTTYILLEEILARGGLTTDDIVFQPLVDLAALNASITNDRIDGAIWSVGGLSPVQADGTGLRYISLAANDVPELKDIPLVASFATREWAEANIETLRNLQAAMVDVIAALRADPLGYAEPYRQRYLAALSDEVWADNLPQAVAAYLTDVEGTAEGWDFWIDRLEAETGNDMTAARHANAYLELSR